jgi:diacylglycerol kinase family enzyme
MSDKIKRFLVLVNPLSHGGRSVRILPRLRALLPEGEFVVLKNIEEASRLAREAKGYEAVVACGGDGTINAVAGGVMENSDTSLKFGVIYAGTSPDFCRVHGIPTDAEQAISVLRDGVVREIPVLTANSEPFFCSMNLGMGAAVAASANRLRPKFGDFIGTLWAVLREVIRGRRYDLKVNGEEIRNVAHALVTRMSRIAGGLKIALPPLADDEYALWFAKDVSRFGCLRIVWNLYRGKPCGEIRVLRGKTGISSDFPLAVEYDGDPHGSLPVSVDLFQNRLRLVVSQNEGECRCKNRS